MFVISAVEQWMSGFGTNLLLIFQDSPDMELIMNAFAIKKMEIMVKEGIGCLTMSKGKQFWRKSCAIGVYTVTGKAVNKSSVLHSMKCFWNLKSNISGFISKLQGLNPAVGDRCKTSGRYFMAITVCSTLYRYFKMFELVISEQFGSWSHQIRQFWYEGR